MKKGMRAPTHCRVARTRVALRGANYPTLAIFSAGELGRVEAGHYHFWTAVFREPRTLEGKKRRRSIARAQAVHPPGERFERMRHEATTAPDPDERAHNSKLWRDVLERGRNIQWIRPSTEREVRRWCEAHESDARHITILIVRGERVQAP
jgi:hypothetical protein